MRQNFSWTHCQALEISKMCGGRGVVLGSWVRKAFLGFDSLPPCLLLLSFLRGIPSFQSQENERQTLAWSRAHLISHLSLRELHSTYIWATKTLNFL